MKSPELPSHEELKAIDKMIDNDIFYQEHEKIHEVPRICEGNETGDET